MTSTIELRVAEEFAHLLFDSGEGRRLGGSVRVVQLDSDDPRLGEVKKLQEEIQRQEGRSFFYGWQIRRHYTTRELDSAALFLTDVTSWFEPAGEECGTTYDESSACSLCGAGAQRSGPLMLKGSSLPKSKDFAMSIGRELIVSDLAREVFQRHGFGGVSFEPVYTRSTRSGEGWNAVNVASPLLQVVSPTVAGNNPIDLDPEGKGRCPNGHLLGLNLLSEVTVRRPLTDVDITFTAEFVGTRRGLVRPERLLLVSQRVRQIVQEERLRGWNFEVAHYAE